MRVLVAYHGRPRRPVRTR